MPRFDGTGPNGEGAMTGRAAGRCNSNVSENDEIQYNASNLSRRGLRNGTGLKRGLRNGNGRGFGNRRNSRKGN